MNIKLGNGSRETESLKKKKEPNGNSSLKKYKIKNNFKNFSLLNSSLEMTEKKFSGFEARSI